PGFRGSPPACFFPCYRVVRRAVDLRLVVRGFGFGLALTGGWSGSGEVISPSKDNTKLGAAEYAVRVPLNVTGSPVLRFLTFACVPSLISRSNTPLADLD